MAELQSHFPAGAFARGDESPDALFYTEPRLVSHIDDYAIAAVGEAYRAFLPPGGEYLDLMGSWVSHFPAGFPIHRLVGLGLNEVELSQNPRLDEYVVHDLNRDPALPFESERFDGVVICVSVQYLTRPVAVCAEIGRVLKPGAPLIVTYSNRCFPTKAVQIWLALDDLGHGALVKRYTEDAAVFADVTVYDMQPGTPRGAPAAAGSHGDGDPHFTWTDPLYAVVAHKRQSSA